MNKKLIIVLVIMILIITCAFQIKIMTSVDLLINDLKKEPQVVYAGFPSKYMGEHVLTHYTHTGNRTASGVYPKAGRTVAVDTRVIPHGTLLYIEGVGYRIAEDTGADIKGKRLDIFVDSHEEAVKKGVKRAKVYILQ